MRRRSQLQISLFPFLSILLCVIGTLTLLIAGLSLGAVGEDYRAGLGMIEDEAGPLRKEQSELEKAIEEATGIARRIEAVRREADRLRSDAAEMSKLDGRIAELLDHLAQVRPLHEELREEVLSARRELEQAVSELGNRRKRTVRVQLRPGGSAEGLQPRFVVCSSTGILTDPDRPLEQQRFVPTSRITSSRLLVEILREVKSSSDQTLTLLVRPGGVDAFHAALGMAKLAKCRCGFLPVPGDQEIDFSLFWRREGR